MSKPAGSPVADAPNVQAEPPKQQKVTPQAENPNIVAREEKVEYRDEAGNILDEEAVKSLEGKVSFKTRYETRTRMVDAQGNEIEAEGVAPPHPDVEGQNPETAELAEDEASREPPVVSASEDEAKEASAEGKEKKGAPRPASEAKEATKQ